MKYTKINNLEELKKHAADGCDIIINLGGIKASRFIQYLEEGMFWIWSMVDDSTCNLTEKEILKDNIGIAMKNGNLYLETS